MKKAIKFIILFFSICLIFPADSINDSEKPKERKNPRFLDKVESKNPEAQSEVGRLKEEFYNEREKIHQKYEIRIKDLKKNRNDEIARLKERYKKRLDRLRKKYPDIPELVIQPKPKPKPKPKPRLKPLEVKDRNDKKDIKKRKNRFKKNVPSEEKSEEIKDKESSK